MPLDARLAVMPGGFGAIEDIHERRAAILAMLKETSADAPPFPNVEWSDRRVSSNGSAPQVRVYRPTSVGPGRPGLIYIHGGGMLVGSLDRDHVLCQWLCERLGAVVISLDYRKAPEHPYPAGLDDCYAGSLWVFDRQEELGIDAGNVGVYGSSAGGGLAIGVALKARDLAGPQLRYVMAAYPMLDDRNETPSSREIVDVGAWDRSTNIQAWAMYLAGRPADAYAAPSMAGELAGLPPMFLDVGELDLFRDEDLDFAQRLTQAGVPCEFHLHPGAFHGSEVTAPRAALSKRIWDLRLKALERFMEMHD